MTSTVDPGAERRHPPGPEPWWQEAWAFDFATATADGALGGAVRLALLPHRGVSWYWACVVGTGRPLVSLADDEAPLPRAGLEVRAEGLWCDHTCEAALDHWTLGLEAFAVALDDPAEAWGRAVGDRVALGLDLEWETSGPPWAAPRGSAYRLPCTVVGDVLVGAERIEIDGHGHREHAWGPELLGPAPWWALTGRLDDGTALAGSTATGGVVWGADGPRAGEVVVTAHDGEDLLAPAPVRAGVGGLDLGVEVLHPAPVPVPGPAPARGRLSRALCRLGAADGRRGLGWAQHRPA